MKLIVGLGNPGSRYEKTLHNTGFLAIENLVRTYGYDKHNQAFQADIFISKIQGEKVVFAKPLTFMNLSGHSVRQLIDYYKVPLNDVLIIHDEKDFPRFRIQFKQGGSAAGHNGLKSIIQYLKTDDFKRLRIGIGQPLNSQNLADYVLSTFDSQAQIKLNENLKLIAPFLGEWIHESDFSKIMNRYNSLSSIQE